VCVCVCVCVCACARECFACECVVSMRVVCACCVRMLYERVRVLCVRVFSTFYAIVCAIVCELFVYLLSE
jgi:hypothetical protein